VSKNNTGSLPLRGILPVMKTIQTARYVTLWRRKLPPTY